MYRLLRNGVELINKPISYDVGKYVLTHSPLKGTLDTHDKFQPKGRVRYDILRYQSMDQPGNIVNKCLIIIQLLTDFVIKLST